MKCRVVIAAGGSGGHVLPAQVVAEELCHADVSICFAGFGLVKNPFFERSRWEFHDIAAAPPGVSFHFAKETVQGLFQSLLFLRKQRPCLVVGFGSYHIFPVLAAASLLRIPTVLYAADAVPGRMIRLFSPLARWTGCFFEEAKKRIRGKSVFVTFPLRQAMLSPPTKEEGRAYFGLAPHLPALLVLGGSQGAQFLNTIVPHAVGGLRFSPLVIHLAGHGADTTAIYDAYLSHGITALVRPFEQAMHFAFAASDIVIGRAGASTIAEIEAFQKPALYIPYPQAMDDHQKKNADLAAQRGKAIVIDEKKASACAIADALHSLLEGCSEKCEYPTVTPLPFVPQLLHTLDEVSVCLKR